MGRVKLGAVITTLEDPGSGLAPTWEAMKDAATMAEHVGFDTVWVPDELQWESDSWDGARGWWEGVAVTAAIAQATTTIEVGTWVLSALHRNPGLTVRIAETIDEISGGRFILGYGAGHAGRQGEAFGFPPDKTVGRYEEALTILTELLQGGSSTFSGLYHSTNRQVLSPRGPRPGGIPLLLGGHGPRTMGLAVKHADIWSAFVTESSQPEAFAPMIEQLAAICETHGREQTSLGRSVGVFIRPPGTPDDVPPPGPSLGGTEDEIIGDLERFADMGVTRVEFMVPGEMADGFERLAEVVQKAASI